MKLNRRAFLLASTAGLIGATGLVRADKSQKDQLEHFTLPKRPLGQTGLRPSLLGIGTGTMGFGGSSDQTRLGQRNLVSLLEYAYDRGVTYFDLADAYGSHDSMSHALQAGGGSIPREDVFLLTKSHARTAESMRRDLDRFRRELGTDVLDVVLLHCKFSGDWPQKHAGAMEALSEAKSRGIVRAHGVSCHSIQALKTAAREPWVDVDLARLNPWGRHMDSDVVTVKEVLSSMRARKKGVIGMKILAQGEARSAADVEKGIRYALDSRLLDAFTVGVRSRSELDEILGVLARQTEKN